MDQRPDWNHGSSGNKQDQPATRKRPAGLLFSGILISISLLAFVLPLAAYHVAQVASIVRVRTSIFLLLMVSVSLYALGAATQQAIFAMAGMTGVLCSPLLALVLLLRTRRRSVYWALVVLALPVAFVFLNVLAIPQGFDVRGWLTAEIAKLPERQGLNKDLLLQQLTSSPGLEAAQNLFDLYDWQRVAAFLFSEGGAFSVSVFASLLGTLVLIDFAFSQAERMRGVVAYVLARVDDFPRNVVNLLQQTRDNLLGLASGASVRHSVGDARTADVLRHEQIVVSSVASVQGPSTWRSVHSKIVREPVPTDASDVLGYRFHYSSSTGWNFSAFAVPLWLSLPALGVLLYVASLWNVDVGVESWLPASPQGPWLVWSAFVALMVLAAMGLQGALVIYARLRPLAGLLLILVTLIVIGSLQGGALTLAALLASLGLLDSAYDFRKRLAKSKNAV